MRRLLDLLRTPWAFSVAWAATVLVWSPESAASADVVVLIAVPTIVWMFAEWPGRRAIAVGLVLLAPAGLPLLAFAPSAVVTLIAALGVLAAVLAVSARRNAARERRRIPRVGCSAAAFTTAGALLVLAAGVRSLLPGPFLAAAAQQLPTDVVRLSLASLGLNTSDGGLISVVPALLVGGLLVALLLDGLLRGREGSRPFVVAALVVHAALVAAVVLVARGTGQFDSVTIASTVPRLLPLIVLGPAAVLALAGRPRPHRLGASATLRALLAITVAGTFTLVLARHLLATGVPVAGIRGAVGAVAALMLAATMNEALLPSAPLAKTQERSDAAATAVSGLPRWAAMLAVGGFFFSVHLNAVQWRFFWFVADTTGFDRLIGSDRSIEVLAWGAVAILALRLTYRPYRRGGAALPLELRVSRAWRPLAVAAILLLGIHGSVTVVSAGLIAGPLRSLGIVLVLTAVSPLGFRTVARLFLAATAIPLVGSLGAALAGWDGAFRMLNASRLPGPALLGAERLQGFYPHPNNAGAFAAFAIVIAAAALTAEWREHRHPLMGQPQTSRFLRRSAPLTVLILVGLLVLHASDSLTAAATVVAVLAVRIATPVLRTLSARSRMVIATVGATALTAAPFVAAALLGGGALTGRVHIWQVALAELEPGEWLTGVGAVPLDPEGAFFERLETRWVPGDAHNTAIELLLAAGSPGLIAFWLLSVMLLWAGLRTLDVSAGWSLPVALLPLVIGLSEVVFVHGPADGRDVFLVSVGLLIAWLVQQDQAAEAPTVVAPRSVSPSTVSPNSRPLLERGQAT